MPFLLLGGRLQLELENSRCHTVPELTPTALRQPWRCLLLVACPLGKGPTRVCLPSLLLCSVEPSTPLACSSQFLRRSAFHIRNPCWWSAENSGGMRSGKGRTPHPRCRPRAPLPPAPGLRGCGSWGRSGVAALLGFLASLQGLLSIQLGGAGEALCPSLKGKKIQGHGKTKTTTTF